MSPEHRRDAVFHLPGHQRDAVFHLKRSHIIEFFQGFRYPWLESILELLEPAFFKWKIAQRFSVFMRQLGDKPFQGCAAKTSVEIEPNGVFVFEDRQSADMIEKSNDMAEIQDTLYVLHVFVARTGFEVSDFFGVPGG